MNVCLVVNCSTINYLEYFLKSYLLCRPGYKHDIIIVHRNYEFINKDVIVNTSGGNIIYVNKILPNNLEIEHRAFGSYRYIFNSYKNLYDIFIFMVDHCVIRRDNWIKDAIELINMDEKIGFLASQIFNGHKNYPHPSHTRTPCIIVKTNALKNIHWEFSSDHDGEMRFGDMMVNHGYVGLQIGNKINYAYDSKGFPPPLNTIPTAGNLEHITHSLELMFFPDKKLLNKFELGELNIMNDIYYTTNTFDSKYYINNKYVGRQNLFIDIEPFDKLIYYPSLELCHKYFPDKVKNIGNNIYILVL